MNNNRKLSDNAASCIAKNMKWMTFCEMKVHMKQVNLKIYNSCLLAFLLMQIRFCGNAFLALRNATGHGAKGHVLVWCKIFILIAQCSGRLGNVKVH